jgi:glutamate dehydrogenase
MALVLEFEDHEDSELLDIEELGMDPHGEPSEPGLSSEKLEAYIDDIADTVRVGLDQSISILTPWFFNNMPQVYYQTTPRQEKVRHLSAIITGHVFETKQTLELWDKDRSKVTFIGPGSDNQIIVELAAKIKNLAFKTGALYYSRDKLLFLATFFCSDRKPVDLANPRIQSKIDETIEMILKDHPKERPMVDEFFSIIDNDLVTHATSRRIKLSYKVFQHMSQHEGVYTLLEPFGSSPAARFTVGMKNVTPGLVYETMVYMVFRYGFNIRRSFMAHFQKEGEDLISIFHLILERPDGSKVKAPDVDMRKLNKAIRTLGWVDVDAYDVLGRPPHAFSVNAINLVRSLGTWLHISLGKENPYVYSQYKVYSTLIEESELTQKVVDLFRIRFDPLSSDDRDSNRYGVLREEITEKLIPEINSEVAQNIFKECVKFIDYILRTNYFITTKTGLAFRMDPRVLDAKHYPNQPYGFFFIVGRNFRFFQVRWKDISRGGLRVVMPKNSEDYDSALSGLFDEVYGLSYAQQLKNKDIPEGGSKAVLLLTPGGSRDQAVKGAVNAFLDLLVSEDESHEGRLHDLVGYYNKEELIYLGPDENMTNDLIVWITKQAERRGYQYYNAFMSSKPGAGINHKEFGVTSEGLNVFLENMLEYLGINPRKQSFTVKMTGGPDGDVAGNELKILYREYKENPRVVAIADGFGAAFDPKGLHWPELLRLVENGLSIDHFNTKHLSCTEAYVIKADNKENIRKRNELCFVTPADVFIPAGGRPYTVHDKNWTTFIVNGSPTVKAIVEGANIFFTPHAREELQKAGVLFVKDSSANKTGVICSSFEIIGSLVLKPKEFEAIKKDYVEDVLTILRQKADLEAKLLFREYILHRKETPLVELSLMISKEINGVIDLMLAKLQDPECAFLSDPMFADIIYEHCPQILVKKYKNRILDSLPKAHQVAIVSAYIASYVVYSEGLDWLTSFPEADRFDIALEYMRNYRQTLDLVSAIEKSSMKQKEMIASILKRTATKELTVGWIRGL